MWWLLGDLRALPGTERVNTTLENMASYMMTIMNPETLAKTQVSSSGGDGPQGKIPACSPDQRTGGLSPMHICPKLLQLVIKLLLVIS